MYLYIFRYLDSLRLCDDRLHQNFAKMVLETLLDSASSITLLDLSENNVSRLSYLWFVLLVTCFLNHKIHVAMLQITGWLSHLKWEFTKSKQLSFGIGKSLASLRFLNLRYLIVHQLSCVQYINMPTGTPRSYVDISAIGQLEKLWRIEF